MPSQQEVKWSQLKVGLIVLISTVLLITLLFLMTSASGMGLFSRKIDVYTFFENSSGLKKGGEVDLQGVTIGEVTKVLVSTDPAHKLAPVEVFMKLDPKFHASLHTDSTASLSTVGVLGDTVVEINSQVATGPELQSGDEMRTLHVPTMQDFVKSGQGTIESLNVTISKLDKVVDGLQKGEGTAGQLLKNPELFNHLNATVGQLDTLATNLNHGRGTAGKLLTDDAVYNKLNDTVARLDGMTRSLDSGQGTAGKLLKDPALYNNLNSTVQHANSLLAEADAGRGALGLLAKDPAFAAKLNDTVSQLDTLLNNVNSGKGTLGELAQNPAVYDNLNRLLTETTTLVAMLRQDPKKYLTIHMKVF